MDVKILQSRITELERENEYLKHLLEQAGIDYKRPKQETAIPVEISYQLARRFFSYFWGRTDVFSKRTQNKATGKAGYYPQCDNFWRQGICPKASGNKIKCKECKNRVWTKLTSKHIEAHLRGSREDASDVIGVYPVHPDGTCRFMVFDFDNHEKGAEENDYANLDDSWKEEVDAVRRICINLGIPILVERSRSGSGAHIWIFFEEAVPASLVRRFGFGLLEAGAESVNLKSFRYYDRMLPAQETIGVGELGNLIALPLQGQAIKSENSVFVDGNWNMVPDQWRALFSTKRVSAKRMEQMLEEWNIRSAREIIPLADGDETKPWDRNSTFDRADVSGTMHIVLANQIYIETRNLKPRIQNQIRRMAVFPNPAYYRNNAIGLSNYAQSRFIYLGEDEDGYVCIPRGLLDRLKEKCKESAIKVQIEDKRSPGRPIDAVFTGELRQNQKTAITDLLKHDCGILSAATAFGKTVTCSGIIAEKKVSTLIILDSSALVEQWENALRTFLSINEEMPVYHTKTGRMKTRKSLIGVIQGAKDTSNGVIDIAMAGSLFKKGEPHPRLKEYGMILVDECHHSASDTVSAVLKAASAKYVYGVTATPFRGDHLDRINFMLLGPIRYRYTAKEKAQEQGIAHLVVPRFTRTVCPHGKTKLHINAAYELIRDSSNRNEQILYDIQQCVRNGRTPVVLTRYTEHAEKLYESAKTYADHVFLLIGTKSKKEQRQLRIEMEDVAADESMILIATGQLIGEGFDYPRLDTLMLATPVAWKGIVEQYAGRLNRDFSGKENVQIYDYVDAHIPVFDRMYAKRLRTYKRIGYQLYVDGISEKQEVNAIYGSDSYIPVYETDLKEAKREIVISSEKLGRNKVMQLIRLLKERQEAGVQVTVVTWHPDFYMYGRPEDRIELMEELRNAGFHIELMEEHCEHYAVIDNEIVWYGSMKLLSKDDAEDNIMRVCSREIATELLEMTFHKDNQLLEYQLPI